MDIRSILNKLDGVTENSNLDENKEKEYARAQQQMDRLEKAAKYTGDDEIVRRRMGLPAKLPPIDQWDGKMPEPVGKPDWFSRLTTAGSATDAQAAAVAANKDDNTVAAIKQEKIPQLQNLLSKLKSLTPKMSESSIFESLIREFSEEVFNEEIDAEAQKIINQIEVLVKDLEDMTGDDEEVKKAIASARQEVDTFKKAAGEYTSKMDKELDSASSAADSARAAASTSATGQATGARPASGAKGNEQIRQAQQQLLDAGITAVGKADGIMGPMTAAALKQFQQMAGITVDGKLGPQTMEKLKNAKQIVAQNQLTTSLTAIEQIMAKYKISEEFEDDIENMTVNEVKSLVLKNINQFTLSEQMEIMKLVMLSEEELDEKFVNGKWYPNTPDTTARRSVTGNVDLPANFGRPPVDSKGNPVRPDYMPKDSAAGAAPKAQPAATPAAKPGMWDRLKQFGTTIKNAAKGTTGKAAIGVALGAGLYQGVKSLISMFSSDEIEMDPADKAELLKHMEVVQKFAKDEVSVKALPQDVQTRLQAILSKADKLSKAKAKETPAAASGSATAPNLGNDTETPMTLGVAP